MESCVFSYKNYYGSEANEAEIIDMMCQLLEMLRMDENSKYVNFPALIINYIVNIPPTPAIYEVLKIIIQGANTWTNPFFFNLKTTKSYEQFC